MLVGFGEMAMCWDRYIHNLTMASIILKNKGDIYNWMIRLSRRWSRSRRHIDFITQVQQVIVEWGWFRKKWTWELPLKFKLFWMVGWNIIFTGPGRCVKVRLFWRMWLFFFVAYWSCCGFYMVFSLEHIEDLCWLEIWNTTSVAACILDWQMGYK